MDSLLSSVLSRAGSLAQQSLDTVTSPPTGTETESSSPTNGSSRVPVLMSGTGALGRELLRASIPVPREFLGPNLEAPEGLGGRAPFVTAWVGMLLNASVRKANQRTLQRMRSGSVSTRAVRRASMSREERQIKFGDSLMEMWRKQRVDQRFIAEYV